MTARKSTEVEFRKSQKPQKSAISTLRKSTEVYGSRTLKPAENRTEVYGSVTEVRPPLKRATSAPPSSRVGHRLNCHDIDDLDEISGEMQIALVWCETHRRYEWHSIDRDYVRYGGTLETNRKPLWGADHA